MFVLTLAQNNQLKAISIILSLMCSLWGVAQQNPTIGEIYDFEIGDLFQYWDQPSQGPHGFRQVFVSDKWYSEDLGSVYYKTLRTSYVFPECETCEPQVTIGAIDTLVYSNLDSVISVAGLQPIFDFNGCISNFSELGEGYVSYDTNHSCIDTAIVIHENLIVDSCIISNEYDLVNKGYSNGLGRVSVYYDYYDSVAGSFYSELVYYEKSGMSCGDAESILQVTNRMKSHELNVYPNPSSDGVFFLESKDLMMYEVYNWSGKLVLKSIEQNPSQIDLSAFDSGMYVLSVYNRYGEFLGVKRLIR